MFFHYFLHSLFMKSFIYDSLLQVLNGYFFFLIFCICPASRVKLSALSFKSLIFSLKISISEYTIYWIFHLMTAGGFCFHDFKLLNFFFIDTTSFCLCPNFLPRKCWWLLFYFLSTRILNFGGRTNPDPGFILAIELPYWSEGGPLPGCGDEPVGNWARVLTFRQAQCSF